MDKRKFNSWKDKLVVRQTLILQTKHYFKNEKNFKKYLNQKIYLYLKKVDYSDFFVIVPVTLVCVALDNR